MTHIIQQQYLHIDLNGTESDGLVLQSQLSDLCQHGLMLAIERTLDQYGPSNGHLYIDRLAIDAGTLSFDRLEHDLADVVTQAIEKAIRQQVATGNSTATTDLTIGAYKTEQQAIHEAVVYFLKTGRLPWSYRLPAGKTLEQMLTDIWQNEKQSGKDRRDDYLRLALRSPTARKRLVRQFSTDFLEIIFDRLSPAEKVSLDRVRHILHSIRLKSMDVTYVERQLWETVFGNVAEGKSFVETNVVSETWQNLPVSVRQNKELIRQLSHHWPDVITLLHIDESHEKKFDRTESELIPRTNSSLELVETTVSEALGPKEGIYPDNAGLVLLHLFLPQFFRALGIATESSLLQPDRALCLLHFLATGQRSVSEHELLLPKLLCNIALEAPVELGILLTDAEMDEAGALLDAVIRHWGALGNTSIDGLRGEFLVRPGKLSLRYDGDWLLQVEARTVDVLLDQLPWGIGMIKLPWMERMLWVEWR